MQQAALLRAQQLDIDNTPFQQGRDGLHGFVVTQRVENTLAAGVGKVHILVGKHGTIFARAEIEHSNKAKLIMDGQHPADHALTVQDDARAPGSGRKIIFFPVGYSFLSGLESGTLLHSRTRTSGANGTERIDMAHINYSLVRGARGPAIVEGATNRPGEDGQAGALHGQDIMAEVEEE